MAIGLINRVARLFGYVQSTRAGTERQDTRDGFYAVNESLYDGTAYSVNGNGGYLENILSTYIGSAFCDVNRFKIFPFFMPFKEIVETYQNVLPGTWGKEIRPVAVGEGKTLDPRFAATLDTIWRDSGLDTQKQTFIRWAANFGTVGIRVSTRPSVEGDTRVPVITFDHPRRLHNFEEDSRGNVTAVVLKYQRPVNAGTLADPQWEYADVVEQITKDEFSRTIDGKEELSGAERRNTLGFCPYVIHRHKDNGSAYGDWAYKGSESVVHRINWRISRQDKSVDRHQFPKWFGAGAGDKPETVDMGDSAMSWVKLHPDSPPPLLQAIVADIDQGSAQAFWLALRDEIRGRQPELNFNDVKLLANTSGESLAMALKPTEQAVLNARPGYDHAMIRSLQMATSVGVTTGAVDLLTGFGVEAADKAYRDGMEDFAFADRPALPETAQQQLVKAQAVNAERSEKLKVAKAAQGLPKEVLIASGYTEAEANALSAVQDTPTGTARTGNGRTLSPRMIEIQKRLA